MKLRRYLSRSAVILVLYFGVSTIAGSRTEASPAAPTFTVNSLCDAPADFTGDPSYTICRTTPVNSTCTLRAAIMNANRFAGGGATINIPSGVRTLSVPPISSDDDATGDLNITKTVTIVGAGAATTIIDGGGIDGVFFVNSGVHVTISGVTIRNGNAGFSGSGGGIDNFGALTVNSSVISGNSAGLGGGVFNETLGVFTLNDSTLNGNHAVLNSGGGMENYGTATLNRSMIDGNTASGSGAGLSNRSIMTVNNSTLSHNSTPGYGGGITNLGVLTMNDSTLSANTAGGYGGGLYHAGTSARLFHVTIAGNLADAGAILAGTGGGIANQTGLTIGIWNSLLAENHAASAADDCTGVTLSSKLSSHDYNYIQSGLACLQSPLAHDISGGDTLLGPLQNNGGATPTRALLTGSPALDQIPSNQCLDSTATAPHPDQRGVTRPVNGLCDIGAYEGVQPLFAYGRNLIRNGDAEDSGASSGGKYVGVPDWSLVSNGHFTAVPYNAPGGFPSVPTDTVPTNHGYNFFAGGDLTDTVTTQFVDISPASAAIDNGGLPYTLSADLGGYSSQDDRASVTITFLDATISIVGSPLTIGPVTAADRGDLTGFLYRSLTALIPATARSIEVDIHMIQTNGYNDGYADNLSLVLGRTLYLPLIRK